MEFKILDGRRSFYQWDLNQKLVVEDDRVEQLHFPTEEGNALVCPIYESDGIRMADVPNILLQTPGRIKAFAVADSCTLYARGYDVNPREKPDDYIYTETEVWTAQQAVENALQEAKDDGWLDLTDYIRNTDYATGQKVGVGYSASQYGVFCNSQSHYWQVKNATAEEIAGKTNVYKPIVPGNLDYAVKVGVCENKTPLTAEEKQAACAWMGMAVVEVRADGKLSFTLADGSVYTVAAVKEG